ncbi:hypothetical protein ACFW04_008635 [Cataglyphis niger]
MMIYYYGQYTIYLLYKKKTNKTATTLYQIIEFIKCRLTSKHPQYRLNQQYLFYLLNDANIRQLSRGIYDKMNITNSRVRYTAAEYLEARYKHFHLLIWIKNVPIFGESTIEKVSKFILQYISCKMPHQNISPLLYRRVHTHRRHIHNDNYCLHSKKEGRKLIRRCRFGFPRPVTETLNMRNVTTSKADNEVNINDCNSVLLIIWEDNMDIQFINEKSLLTELSDTILDNMNNKNKSLASYFWNIAFRFMNNRECRALEAANTFLGIPLYGTDQNTTIKCSRCYLDIFYPSLIDNHYLHRPNELENMSLYEFAQWYDISKIKSKNEDIEYYKINNDYYLKRLYRGYLINHYRYDVNIQPENYFFSLLLIFQPWQKLEDLRNECDTYAESFHKVKLHIVGALQYHEGLKELLLNSGQNFNKNTAIAASGIATFNIDGLIGLWTTLFDYDELTINMRQQGNDSYRELLKNSYWFIDKI